MRQRTDHIRTRAFLSISFLLVALTIPGCGPQSKLELAMEALQLSLEHHMDLYEFEDKCGHKKSFFSPPFLSSPTATSTIVVVPLNTEIIKNVVNYKATALQLSNDMHEEMQKKAFEEFHSGRKATFVVLVKNSTNFDYRSKFQFNNFQNNVVLKDEAGGDYPIDSYTKIFDENLLLGWNRGYVNFGDFSFNSSSSYSIHFSQYTIEACRTEYAGGAENLAWAFSFDDSEVGFWGLLTAGLDADYLRKVHNVGKRPELGLDEDDLFRIADIVISTIQLLAKLSP